MTAHNHSTTASNLLGSWGLLLSAAASLATLPCTTSVAAESGFAGRFAQGPLTLELRDSVAGRYEGTLKTGDRSFAVVAAIMPQGLVGRFHVEGRAVYFVATLEGNTLALQLDGRQFDLARRDRELGPGLRDQAPAPAPATKQVADPKAVIVNSQQLSEQQLDALQRLSGGRRMLPGSYWYDRMTGACGREGGPCVAFGLPGLDLGGPLRADASKGDTGVFINGRQLHRLDLLGLRRLLPGIAPGRYWCDADGNIGCEGRPAEVNLVVIARQLTAIANGGTGTPGDHGWTERGSNGAVSYGAGGSVVTTNDGEPPIFIPSSRW